MTICKPFHNNLRIKGMFTLYLQNQAFSGQKQNTKSLSFNICHCLNKNLHKSQVHVQQMITYICCCSFNLIVEANLWTKRERFILNCVHATQHNHNFVMKRTWGLLRCTQLLSQLQLVQSYFTSTRLHMVIYANISLSLSKVSVICYIFFWCHEVRGQLKYVPPIVSLTL